MNNTNISVKTENPERNRTGILELRSITTEMRNSLEGFNGIFQQAEERTSKLEDKTMKMIQAKSYWKKQD